MDKLSYNVLLGSDFCRKHRAIIDYNNMSVKLRRPAKDVIKTNTIVDSDLKESINVSTIVSSLDLQYFNEVFA